jgi:porin
VPEVGLLPLDRQSRQLLLGDWGGARNALAEKGITFDFFYITDVQRNFAGGLRQTGADWQRIRGTIDIDFDRFIR